MVSGLHWKDYRSREATGEQLPPAFAYDIDVNGNDWTYHATPPTLIPLTPPPNKEEVKDKVPIRAASPVDVG